MNVAKGFTRALGDRQQIMLPVRQIQRPKQRHLLDLGSGWCTYISVQTALAKLWLTLRIKVNVGSIVFDHIDDIDKSIERFF